VIAHLLNRLSAWIQQINWQDTRVLVGFLCIEAGAGGYLIWWASGFLRHRTPDTDEEVEEQRPETDTAEPEELEPYSPEPSWFGRLRARWFGEEPAGATEQATTFTGVARRGRLSGDMDSVVDRAYWHDQFRDVAVRFEEALDAKLLEIAERFGFYDEMLQALAATHVHIPDSVEIDDAAAPVIELLEADTMTWTADDQFALEDLLDAEEQARQK